MKMLVIGSEVWGAKGVDRSRATAIRMTQDRNNQGVFERLTSNGVKRFLRIGKNIFSIHYCVPYLVP